MEPDGRSYLSLRGLSPEMIPEVFFGTPDKSRHGADKAIRSRPVQ